MLSIILLVLRLINNDKEPFCSRSKSMKYNNSNKYVAIAERLTDVAFCIRGVSWTLTDVTQPYSFNS